MRQTSVLAHATVRALIFVLIFVSACALLFLGALLYSEADFPTPWVRIPLALFLFTLAILLIRFGSQIIKVPARKPRRVSSNGSFNHLVSRFPSTVANEHLPTLRTCIADGDLESARSSTAQLLEQNPHDCALLWLQYDAHIALGDPAAAEIIADRLLASLKSATPPPQAEPELLFAAARKRLFAILLQNDGRFQTECLALLRTMISDRDKIALLDQLACFPLFEDRPHLYHSSEFCIRQALAIAPESLTLKGTLGALLAERGNFAEAEPLLCASYESGSKNDRGITSYYLALLAENSGDLATARKLAKDSIALYPEPWLVKKANTLLNRLRQP